MCQIKDYNFYTVHGWMINDLKLSGIELQVFAIIYGFSQADGQNFDYSNQLLSNWTNSSQADVEKALASLHDKHLLIDRKLATKEIIAKTKILE